MPTTQISRWIMANIEASGRTAERVRARVLAGECLVDGCADEPTRRGLCTNHYHRFRATLLSKGSAKARAEFEAETIRAGLVLPVGQVRELRNPNPFEVR